MFLTTDERRFMRMKIGLMDDWVGRLAKIERVAFSNNPIIQQSSF